jgi:thiol-disulfide isomerase/thioredoxin
MRPDQEPSPQKGTDVDRTLRILSPLALLALLAFATFAGCSGGSTSDQGSAAEQSQATGGSDEIGCQPGQLAPDFELTDLSGQTVRMSDLKGNVVIVDFWATWCKPCRMALPHFQELQREYGDRGLTIVAIAMDKRGENVVRPFVEKADLAFRVVLNDGQVDHDYCGIFSLPTTFVVGPDGRVARKYIGYRDKSVYQHDIIALKPDLAS